MIKMNNNKLKTCERPDCSKEASHYFPNFKIWLCKEHHPKCGTCDSMDNLSGPYAGGPFPYYCKNCKKIIDKYNEGHRRFKEFMNEYGKKRDVK